MPYRVQLTKLGDVSEYIPSILTIINLPYVNEDTPLSLFSHIFKWERVQKGRLRDFPEIEFKNDIYIEYWTEKSMGIDCCSKVKSLEYSIRLYSPSEEELPESVWRHMEGGYRAVVATGYPREGSVCDIDRREMVLVGAVVMFFSVMAVWALTFYRNEVLAPLLEEGSRDVEMEELKEAEDDSVRDIDGVHVFAEVHSDDEDEDGVD
jgi:hypothetical protein